jgi:hypothetical protein
MLPPEPLVLDGRQCLLDAQVLYAGSAVPRGFYAVSWYGSATSDERGSFGIVDPMMGLADCVGEIVEVTYSSLLVRQGSQTVRVYVIGSEQNLGTDLSITRRCYLELERLALDPITASVGIVS